MEGIPEGLSGGGGETNREVSRITRCGDIRTDRIGPST